MRALLITAIVVLFNMVARSLDTEPMFGIRPQRTMWLWIALDITMLVLQGVGGGIAGTYGDDLVSD